MTRRSRKIVRVGAAYGFAHPDCLMAPPKGVDPAQTLSFDMELVDWVSADKVGGGLRCCGRRGAVGTQTAPGG